MLVALVLIVVNLRLCSPSIAVRPLDQALSSLNLTEALAGELHGLLKWMESAKEGVDERVPELQVRKICICAAESDSADRTPT